MALTRRGRLTVTIVAIVALLAVVGVAFAMAGSTNPVRSAIDHFAGNSTPPPPPCPLTGRQPQAGKAVPRRPVLAVKVENTSAAYPLVGLDKADVIYEELVEGGITRFMVVFQCQDATRVGPVRSARTTDPGLLSQYGTHPLLAYSGGQLAIVNMVTHSALVGLTETSAPHAFQRDGSRVAPHNLYVSTSALYAAGKKAGKPDGAPDAVFSYADTPPGGRSVRSVTVRFSYSVSAQWSWAAGRWVRMLNGAPMKLEDGRPFSADNVLIQQVVVSQGSLVDVLGNHSPEVTLTGTGRAWLLRDGKLIAGRWRRASLHSATVFTTKKGNTLVLKPGTTFVELAPKDQQVSFIR